jgi:RecB family exonuclease
VPLNLIHGPPNSGRAGLIRTRFAAALEHEPVLVVPTVDDVYDFQRELCAGGAVLGGSVMTFGALFETVAVAGGSPPGPKLTPSQRLRTISVAIAARRTRLGPLRRSAAHPGFVPAFERLLDELQAAGLSPATVAEGGAGTLEGSAYLNDLASLFAGYLEVRDRLSRCDSHDVAREAIDRLRKGGDFWRRRPLFLYGLDDLTPEQLELVAAIAEIAEVTVALPHEEGRSALLARAGTVARLQDRVGVAAEIRTEPDPGNTESELLFHLERNFGGLGAERRPPGDDIVLLRSAGERGEAEAIGAEIAKLLQDGAELGEIAIALRDPARRGTRIAAVLESYGLAVALEAELPIAGTAVGGCLLALLEAEFGAGRAADLLRFMRGPSGVPAAKVDRLERSVRRRRVRHAATALELWERSGEPVPTDLVAIREAAGSSAAMVAAQAGRLATVMASRLIGRGSDLRPISGGDLEPRAAGAISNTLAELAELGELAPGPAELARTIEAIALRAWSGPVGDRVRIADPYRLRAGRFDHVFVASLQEGEFPRRDGSGDGFLSDDQRDSLGLEPRRDADAEERYLFYVCLSLPRERLFLSYRDCDENGAAEPRSPLLDEVRRLLEPAPGGDRDPVEESIARVRDLAQVVHPIASVPSEDELARTVAAEAGSGRAAGLLASAGARDEVTARLAARLEAAQAAETAASAPGPLTNPAVLRALDAVPARGGTTLEEFDLCSYRWFTAHELEPQPLDPVPDPLIQGGLMHAALERLYRERPGGDLLPRPASLPAWTERGRELVAEIAAERGIADHPAERAIVRRVERLLSRFLAEESERSTGDFEPWLLEATFGEEETHERPALQLDGWGLHGAIDRVDRAPDGRALVIDYKLSSAVVPREKLEERAKLQLQLYLTAVAELWDARPVGGLYHPLRGSSARRPRGLVRDDAAADLAAYRLYDKDVVDRKEFETMLNEARARAGAIVARMKRGDIRRDPGPRRGLRGHDVCPPFCDFAPICRRDRAPVGDDEPEAEER